MTSEFTTTRRIEFCDTDMAGIVHFANFYRYMEQAEHEFFRSLNLTIMLPRPDGSVIGWPRVSAKCRFLAPAYYDDVLDVFLQVARKGLKSLTYQIEFRRGETPIAKGEIKTVCCICRHNQPLESIEIPPEYSDVIDQRSTAE